jgi:hypothetical protein
MVNMPFFAQRLNWGSSVRGAWWEAHNGIIQLSSGCLWQDGTQVCCMEFTKDQWSDFITAVVLFGAKDDSKT